MPAMSRLYWYGWKSSNLEVLSNDNGWTPYYRRNFYPPEWQTNRLYFPGDHSFGQNGVGNKEALPAHSKICILNTPTSLVVSYGSGNDKTCSSSPASLTSGYVELANTQPYFCTFCYDPNNYAKGYVDFIFIKE